MGLQGVIFLLETHPSVLDEKELAEDFNCPTFSEHGKRNSYGVLMISSIRIRNFQFNENSQCHVGHIDQCHNGHILILDVTIDDSDYILINSYNTNTKAEQVGILNKLVVLQENFDFNLSFCREILILFFDSLLDASGGNVTRKKKLLAKLLELNKKFDICDIWTS